MIGYSDISIRNSINNTGGVMGRYYLSRLLVVACLSAVCAGAHATNGYAIHGIGTKSKALAGSGASLPQDALVMAINPAAIVHLDKRLDAGIALFSPRRSYSVSGFPSGAPGSFGLAPGSYDSDSDYFLIPNVGYVSPIDSQSSWGISAFGNGGMNTNFPAFANGFCPPGTPGTGPFCFGGAGINLQQLFITPTYARKIGSNNTSLGVSLVGVVQTFKARGLEAFGGFSADPAHLTGNGTDISNGIGIRLAGMTELTPGLFASLSLQPRVRMSKFKDYAGLFAEQGDFDIPGNANLGLAWHITPDNALTFDVQYIQFSAIDSVGNMITQLNPGGNPFGSSAGPGFGWDDMTVYKLGYQWNSAAMPGWTWRLGLSHTSQPIPDSEVTLNILAPAVVETHVTGGFTRDMGNNQEFSLSLLYAPSKSVSGPNALDPGQTVEIEMKQFEVELGYTWKF